MGMNLNKTIGDYSVEAVGFWFCPKFTEMEVSHWGGGWMTNEEVTSNVVRMNDGVVMTNRGTMTNGVVMNSGSKWSGESIKPSL